MICIIALTILFPVYGWASQEYTPQNTGFFFDIDGVMSIKHKPSILGYLKLLPRVVWSCPTIVKLAFPKNRKAFWTRVSEETKKNAGSSNVIHNLLGYLKDHGYGDLSYYENDILALSLNPEPLYPLIDAAINLKKQGYMVFGTTNQDAPQHAAYYQKMRAVYRVDLAHAFHAVLTVKAYNGTCVPGQPYYQHEYTCKESYPIYSACGHDAHKPNKSYFDAARELMRDLSPQGITQEWLIFTDDEYDNVEGAARAGLKAHHMCWDGDKASQTSPERRETIMQEWIDAIKNSYRINVGNNSASMIEAHNPLLLTN